MCFCLAISKSVLLARKFSDKLSDKVSRENAECEEHCVAKLSREEGTMAENLSKRRKATGAMLGACALGVVILVI